MMNSESPPTRSADRRPATAQWLTRGLAIAGLLAVEARAQDQVQNYAEQPILALQTGAHYAPVRSILFADSPDGRLKMLTGGFDKVVQEWDVSPTSIELSRTIRPPRWRGLRGRIYAMALQPRPNPGDDRILAIAGSSVEGNYGTIALYRYPGRSSATGDLLGFLYEGKEPADTAEGHLGTVNSIDFDPTGRYLATGGTDRRVLIWDLDRFKSQVDPKRTADIDPADKPRPIAKIADHRASVEVVRFAANGRLLLTATGINAAANTVEGAVRLFDVSRPETPVLKDTELPQAVAVAGAHYSGPSIHALAVSDDQYVLVGREEGRLDVYNLNNVSLTYQGTLNEKHQSVEALACGRGPDGRRLFAVSFLGKSNEVALSPEQAATLRDPTCVVEVRSLDPPQVLLHKEVGNLVYALAFTPDGRLAYSGGDRQSVIVADFAGDSEIKQSGKGSSVWDVGFVDGDDLTLAFSPTRTRADAPAPSYFAFDLAAQRPVEVVRGNRVRRAIRATNGWSLQPGKTAYDLQLIGPAGPQPPIHLDELQDRRWWSHTFLLPAKDGPAQLALAIACETGVAIYDVATRRRTRFLAAHEGPVYALAPSPDGRWLATGSADQTVRLWSLKDCDRPPPFGATFEPIADGRFRVAAVLPRSPAQAIGLQTGSVVDAGGIGTQAFAADGVQVPNHPNPAPLAHMIARLDAETPGVRLDFSFLDAKGDRKVATTTKQDSPVLSLFRAVEGGEWVAWMPQGYYDTSVLGDVKLLGWHFNRSSVYRPAPTDFVEMKVLEPDYRQPNVLKSLLATANPAAAVAAARPARNVGDVTPPPAQVTINGIPVTMSAPGPDIWTPQTQPFPIPPGQTTIAVSADAETSSPITSIAMNLGNVPVAPPTAFAPAVARAEATFAGALPGSGRAVLNVILTNAAGLTREQLLAVDLGVAPAPGPHLSILALGVETFADESIAPVARAEVDAEDLTDFFRRVVVTPGGKPYGPDDVSAQSLVAARATSAAVREKLEALLAEVTSRYEKAGRPLHDDVVIVAIETHLINPIKDGQPVMEDEILLGSDDPKVVKPLRADEVTRALGAIGATGATAVLILDVVHAQKRGGPPSRATNWIRDLNDEGVIVVTAAGDHPSRDSDDHRAFARGVLDPLTFAAADGPVSFGDFRDLWSEAVRGFTTRLQTPEFFVPRRVQDVFVRPIIDPAAP